MPSSDSTDNSSSIESQVKERVRKAKKRLEEKRLSANLKKDFKITSKWVRECVLCGELGDGLVYTAIHAGKYIFNKSAGEWLKFDGHSWKMDIMTSALADVERVCEVYKREAVKVSSEIDKAIKDEDQSQKENLQRLKKQINGRVARLRTERGRVNCLKFAHTNYEPLAVTGNEFDKNALLLGCKNGAINLQTGKLRDGRPEDFISKASPVAYPNPLDWTAIDEMIPTWLNFLEEILSGDKEMVSYLSRLFGYGISGLTKEHILPVLFGCGRNGKDTLLETILFVLGDMASPIPSEMLLDQGHVRSSAGPSPDIMSLRGLRLAFASETEEGKRFNLSRVKWLSGGNSLVGRNPHDKHSTIFEATHTLFLSTNHKPHAASHDYAFWQRLHLIPFELSFVDRKPQAEFERKADKELLSKLKFEASGILAWLVRGCIQYQQIGLAPPQKIIDAVAAYLRDEDRLADFIEACCCLDPEATTASAVLYDSFKEWYSENESQKYIMPVRKFGLLMGKKFERIKSGTIYYKGIALSEDLQCGGWFSCSKILV